MYILQFFNLVVPLVTLPYITRILGSGAYGTFSIALNIVSYLQVVVEYGFGMSATRKVAMTEININKLFSAVLLSRVILLILSLVISLFYILFNHNNSNLCWSFSILTICLLGYCVQVNWLFQGLQEMKYISIVNVVARIISVALIFVFVKTADDIFMYCFLYSISPFLSGFIGLFVAKNRYKLKFIKMGFADILMELKDGVYVFTTQLSGKVFGAIGVTFLGLFESESTVGIYSAIYKIPNILLLLWMPISQVIYPITSRRFKDGFKEGYSFVRTLRRRIMPFFIAIALLVGILSKKIVNIVCGSEYVASYFWVLPLLAWMIMAIENNFLGIQTMLGSGHDKEYGTAFQIGVVCTIAFNFVLIITMGGLGAAIAPMISELVLHILLRWKLHPIVGQGMKRTP